MTDTTTPTRLDYLDYLDTRLDDLRAELELEDDGLARTTIHVACGACGTAAGRPCPEGCTYGIHTVCWDCNRPIHNVAAYSGIRWATSDDDDPACYADHLPRVGVHTPARFW